jgi:hypothetical protein
MDEQVRIPVVPTITKNNEEVENVAQSPSNVKSPTVVQYVSFEDFNINLKSVEVLWKSKEKMLSVMPMTKADRDEALKPINGQKIEAQSDGTTKGFYISIELFDQIKQAVVCASLKHYVDQTGKPVITKKKLGEMDNKSYEELAEICLSINKIDFFDTGASDVGAAADVKN